MKGEFRGVTKIIADGGDGADDVHIMPDVPVPVELRGGEDSDQFVVDIGDLALSETVDGGAGEDQIVIVGDSSRRTCASRWTATMWSRSARISTTSKRGSVTLANVEAITLSGGEGADTFSVSGELDLGGVTGVVVEMGSVTSESDQLPDGALDEVHLTLSDSSDQFELAPAGTGVQGIWKNHFTFSVLTPYGSDGDKVDVLADGGDDLVTVFFDPQTYGTSPEQGGPVNPEEVLEIHLTDESGSQFGPAFSLDEVENLIIGALVVDSRGGWKRRGLLGGETLLARGD